MYWLPRGVQAMMSMAILCKGCSAAKLSCKCALFFTGDFLVLHTKQSAHHLSVLAKNKSRAYLLQCLQISFQVPCNAGIMQTHKHIWNLGCWKDKLQPLMFSLTLNIFSLAIKNPIFYLYITAVGLQGLELPG